MAQDKKLWRELCAQAVTEDDPVLPAKALVQLRKVLAEEKKKKHSPENVVLLSVVGRVFDFLEEARWPKPRAKKAAVQRKKAAASTRRG